VKKQAVNARLVQWVKLPILMEQSVNNVLKVLTLLPQALHVSNAQKILIPLPTISTAFQKCI
jgi:hypothetical protein